jgi:hypothetical protein
MKPGVYIDVEITGLQNVLKSFSFRLETQGDRTLNIRECLSSAAGETTDLRKWHEPGKQAPAKCVGCVVFPSLDSIGVKLLHDL